MKLSLNLGSGDRTYDKYPEKGGYKCINLDKRLEWERVDVASDVRRLPFQSDSFEYILASDIIEHFPFKLTKQLLTEWARVLKPGGILEIRTPNLRWVHRAYKEGQNAQWISHHIFGGQDYPGNYHFVIFDREWLSLICKSVKLTEVDYWEAPAHSNFILKVRKDG
jgi:predicted SAM-dependent methyltransferase